MLIYLFRKSDAIEKIQVDKIYGTVRDGVMHRTLLLFALLCPSRRTRGYFFLFLEK